MATIITDKSRQFALALMQLRHTHGGKTSVIVRKR